MSTGFYTDILLLQFYFAIEGDAPHYDLQFVGASKCGREYDGSLVFLDEIGENDNFVFIQQLHHTAFKSIVEGQNIAIPVNSRDVNRSSGWWVANVRWIRSLDS